MELYRGATSEDNFLNMFGSSNSVVFDSPKVDIFTECSTDSAQVINWYRRARAGTTAAGLIP